MVYDDHKGHGKLAYSTYVRALTRGAELHRMRTWEQLTDGERLAWDASAEACAKEAVRQYET